MSKPEGVIEWVRVGPFLLLSSIAVSVPFMCVSCLLLMSKNFFFDFLFLEIGLGFSSLFVYLTVACLELSFTAF